MEYEDEFQFERAPHTFAPETTPRNAHLRDGPLGMPVQGVRVIGYSLEGALTLKVDSGYAKWTVRIATAFELIGAGNLSGRHPAPRDAPPGMTDAAAEFFIGEVIEEGIADEHGTLRLDLTSGASVEIPADADQEAWNILGPDGEHAGCRPGGSLAIWDPDFG